MLRIGFDAKRLLNNFTGFGNYSRTLIADLVTHHPEHDYLLFTPEITDTVETQRLLESPSIKIVSPPRHRKFFWRSFGSISVNYNLNLFSINSKLTLKSKIYSKKIFFLGIFS